MTMVISARRVNSIERGAERRRRLEAEFRTPDAERTPDHLALSATPPLCVINLELPNAETRKCRPPHETNRNPQ